MNLIFQATDSQLEENDEYVGFYSFNGHFRWPLAKIFTEKTAPRTKDLTNLETNIFASENGWLENGWLEYC